ncbi:and other transporter-domain-containing protein [Clohesyomyces aquaticus]|uniref:And other transporter-domain-containing protein n=1 Tax=Clohesyomyces aquaticus TaxID=1231657 RepID=A0A1Y1ZEG1_9PLEO|nr:and other transporter-domain-containing protein [Clohesyomyces aquaticus]
MARFLGLRGQRLCTVISAVCALCFLCFGYAQGVLGGLLTVPAFLERFPQIDTINNSSLHNARLQGITVGTWNLGCFASAILTIFVGDVLGRRRTLMLGLVLWMIGEIIQCSSYSFAQLLAGRFIAGFGNGFTTSTVPAYQAECVKSHRKGTILMISAGAFIALGLTLSYWLVFAFAYVPGSSAWRVPIAFQVVFALIALIVLLWLPESPRWLILTGRETEALTVLAALNDSDIDGPEIRDEFLQIKDAILIMSKGSTSSLRSNDGDKRNLHRTVLAYLVQVFQQMSGINLALQYLALMFLTQMGFSSWLSRVLAGCASTEYFLASFVAVVGIDRFWGRRSLMMFGAAGMSLCMVLLTVLGYLFQERAAKGTNIAAAVFLFAFSTFFAIGWQGMAWLYQVEVVPLRIRGPANALSTSGNWLFNFIVVFITPISFHTIHYRTYIIFALTNLAIVPLVYFLYPETAYRSLEEVDMLFHIASQTPNPWLGVVKIAAKEPLWYGRKGEVEGDYESSKWHQNFFGGVGSGTTLGNGGVRCEKGRGNGSPEGSEESAVGSGDGGGDGDRRSPLPGHGHGNGYGSSSPGSGSEYPTSHSHAGTRSHHGQLSELAPTSTSRPISLSQALYRRPSSHYSTKSTYSSPDASWQNSSLAPAPLRVSRSTSHGSGVTAVDESPLMGVDADQFPLPGRVVRQSGGTERTRLPDGQRDGRSSESRRSWGSEKRTPREAGRGY